MIHSGYLKAQHVLPSLGRRKGIRSVILNSEFRISDVSMNVL